jgi:hypothetical protein
MGEGGAQLNISRYKIINTLIPLPPTIEQEFIVEKVDELMKLCDQLENYLHEQEKIREKTINSIFNSLINNSSNYSLFKNIYLKIPLLSCIKVNKYLDDNMMPFIDEFKKIFTKQYLGLDKLVNLACASDRQGYLAGTKEFEQDDITENKYMTLSALVSFKEALYEKMLSRFETNLGKDGW